MDIFLRWRGMLAFLLFAIRRADVASSLNSIPGLFNDYRVRYLVPSQTAAQPALGHITWN